MLTYEIEAKNIPHSSGNLVLYTVVTINPGGLRHISSVGRNMFETFALAQAEVDRRISKEVDGA